MTRFLDYQDINLSNERRCEDLLSRMTLEEKAGQLFHPYTVLPDGVAATELSATAAARESLQEKFISHVVMFNGTTRAEISSWTRRLQEMAASTRLGIPVTVSTDPRSGYRSSPYSGITMDESSRWPEHVGIAAVRDTRLVEEYGDVVRQELIQMGIRSYLGPMADLFTEPRWPRGSGTFGEDVEVVSALTAAFIRGLQHGRRLGPHSVAAVVKHFPGAGPQRAGNDAIDERYPDQVYPGGMQRLHLRPFEAALAAGASHVMAYYGMPVGTDWEERGFAFNTSVIQDLLRNTYHFGGVVTTDWNVIDSGLVGGELFGPIAHGVQELTVGERLQLALSVGVDQFGGDTATGEVCELVRTGKVSEQRVDRSVRRILLAKFQLGLFDSRAYGSSEGIAGRSNALFSRKGTEAQQRSLTLLKDSAGISLCAGTSVYAEGIIGAADHGLIPVKTPEEADVNVVRIDSPWVLDDDNMLSKFMHGGSLEFPPDVILHIQQIARQAPTVLVVYLERPAVLTPIVGAVDVLLGDYGASDEVIWKALTGYAEIGGVLPFDLPRSTSAIEASREDVPFDTKDPLFRCGYGIRREAHSGCMT